MSDPARHPTAPVAALATPEGAEAAPPLSEAEWRALLDPPPPIDLNVAVPAFRNYLRDYRPQVRAGFELAEMAGGRIKPAEWEAEAAKQRAEWRERLPVDCPPPPPHRPPVWNQAEFEADMDNLTRALDALQHRRGRKPGGGDRKLEARNKWLYRQCCNGREMPYANIIAELKRIASAKGWEPIESVQGIRAAAKRYAASHPDLPPIPNRQNL